MNGGDSFSDSILENASPASSAAGLVDRAAGGDQGHEVGPPAVGSDRHPTADNLSKRREVRPNAESCLGAARPKPEAGDHLVEHEQRTISQRS